MQVICINLEGVFVPKIWIEFSKRTGITELARTTRDEPDYDELMKLRIGLLAQHQLKLADIQNVIPDRRRGLRAPPRAALTRPKAPRRRRVARRSPLRRWPCAQVEPHCSGPAANRGVDCDQRPVSFR